MATRVPAHQKRLCFPSVLLIVIRVVSSFSQTERRKVMGEKVGTQAEAVHQIDAYLLGPLPWPLW